MITKRNKTHADNILGAWPTGGNFYYGLQAGLSINAQDLFVRAGKILTQDFKTQPHCHSTRKPVQCQDVIVDNKLQTRKPFGTQ